MLAEILNVCMHLCGKDIDSIYLWSFIFAKISLFTIGVLHDALKKNSVSVHVKSILPGLHRLWLHMSLRMPQEYLYGKLFRWFQWAVTLEPPAIGDL